MEKTGIRDVQGIFFPQGPAVDSLFKVVGQRDAKAMTSAATVSGQRKSRACRGDR